MSTPTPPLAHTYFEARPWTNAPGYLNGLLEEELEALGYSLRRHYQCSPGGTEHVPLAAAARAAGVAGEEGGDEEGAPELAAFCDFGLEVPGAARDAERTLVTFYGYAGGRDHWLAGLRRAVLAAPSPYARDVLVSALVMPDWRRRRVLDPTAEQRAMAFTPALPILEAEEGVEEMAGAGLPPRVEAALEAGDLVAHAVQPGKLDWERTFSMMVALNVVARREGAPPVRLVVPVRDYATLDYSLRHDAPLDLAAARAILAAAELDADDLFLPVPQLSQPAFFGLLRRSAFGLSYITQPETIGFYGLESVYLGSPLYTNGAGNVRHTLPAGHGITVLENPAMYDGVEGAYQHAARQILADLSRPDAVAEACGRGRRYVAETYHREAYSRSVRAAVERTAEAPFAAVPFADREVALGPQVRHVDEASGWVLSDHRHQKLDAAGGELLRRVLGRPAGEVADGLAGSESRDRLERLFLSGVLWLRPSGRAEGLGNGPGDRRRLP